MRLLNVHTRQLAEGQFFDSKRTKYAILSHRWAAEELTLQDLNDPGHRSRPGYAKILGACQLAQSQGHDFIWIDTCCIDKTSSTELAEAINSMFRWYEDADTCYAYLADVTKQPTTSKLAAPPEMICSEWFQRGWTLQELLAPWQVEFYDGNWSFIGTRTSLQDLVSQATGIPAVFLSGERSHRSACVAQRMAWAASRQTSKLEDQAYSLLGLFGVHMPLLYGEGERAFQRLQQEILKQSSDQSLFAWGTMNPPTQVDDIGIPLLGSGFHDSSLSYPTGVFAPHPSSFSAWAAVRLTTVFDHKSEVESTGSKVLLSVPTISGIYGKRKLLLLNCRIIDDSSESILAVVMIKDHATGKWFREAPVHRRMPRRDRGSEGPMSNGSVFLVPWRAAKYARYERVDASSKMPPLGGSEFSTASVPETFGPLVLQTSPELPERLIDVFPPEAHHKEANTLAPQREVTGEWQRIVLFFQSKKAGTKGYAVILDQRTVYQAFFTCRGRSPPYICHVVPMPSHAWHHFTSLPQRDQQSAIDLFRDQPSSNVGDSSCNARIARIHHERFLGQHHFVLRVEIYQPDAWAPLWKFLLYQKYFFNFLGRVAYALLQTYVFSDLSISYPSDLAAMTEMFSARLRETSENALVSAIALFRRQGFVLWMLGVTFPLVKLVGFGRYWTQLLLFYGYLAIVMVKYELALESIGIPTKVDPFRLLVTFLTFSYFPLNFVATSVGIEGWTPLQSYGDWSRQLFIFVLLGVWAPLYFMKRTIGFPEEESGQETQETSHGRERLVVVVERTSQLEG